MQNHKLLKKIFISTLVLAPIALVCIQSYSRASSTEKKSDASTSQTQKKPISKIETNPLKNVQAKYKNVKTLSAEFTQKQINVALGTTKESVGNIFILRPDKFRWQTLEPEKSILVGNGKKVWYYTPPETEKSKGQVMVRRAADVQSRLALDLLAGSADTEKSFKVKELAPFHYHLKPLKPAGDVEHIELYVEKSTNLVYKLVLFTTIGNQTELVLKNVILGPKLSESMFNFVVPPNTEEIR